MKLFDYLLLEAFRMQTKYSRISEFMGEVNGSIEELRKIHINFSGRDEE